MREVRGRGLVQKKNSTAATASTVAATTNTGVTVRPNTMPALVDRVNFRTPGMIVWLPVWPW